MFSALMRKWLGVHFYYMLVRPLRRRPEAHGAPSGLDCRVLPQEELIAACADAELRLRAHSVRKALEAGNVCVAAFHEGRLAGYVWYSFVQAPHDKKVKVLVGPRLRYAYKVHVRPSLRGRGIARELLARGEELCPRRDRELGLSFVAPDNGASLRVFAAAGWRRAGYAGYVAWPGCWRAFGSTGAGRLGAGFACA